MKIVLIVFFVISLIMMLLVFPFKSRMMGHLNLIEKKGFYSFKVWKLKILCGMVYVDENNNLKIENTNNAIKDRYKEDYMKGFIFNILKFIEVKKTELYFSGGIKENSFNSAIICSVARLVVDIVYSFFSQRYEEVKLFEEIKPTFEKDSLELTIDFVAEISIIQILISFIKAKLKNKEAIG